jgi:hypothetical protein
MKKFVILLAALALGLSQVSCTSGKSSSDDQEITTDSTDAELERVDSADGTETSDAFLEETLPQEKLGEVAAAEPVNEEPAAPPAADVAQVDTLLPTDTAPASPATEAPAPVAMIDEGGTANDSLVTDAAPLPPPPSPVATIEAPKAEEPVQDNSVAATSDFNEPIKVATGSLKKVDEVPRKGPGGVWLNAVYIARPGDTFTKISKRIYGSKDQASSLRKSNSWISSLKPGNKVYYNSPKRPDDNSKVLTFFEDEGIAPEIYVAKEGDNIRSVSKELLGYSNAWQEVWSTNAVVSRGDLQPGTELRYWKSMPAAIELPAATNVAANAPAEMPAQPFVPQQAEVPVDSAPPPPPVAESTPPAEMPPPAQDMAAAQPPPPPPDMAIAPPQELPPPPPPPVAEVSPPPPPPPVETPVAAASVEDDSGAAEGGITSDTMVLGGAGALALILVGLIIARKRKQQKELAAFSSNAQVGT